MRIDKVEGIGPRHRDALVKAGVRTTKDLLDAAGRKSDRLVLAAATGISASRLHDWVSRVEMQMIHGIGPGFNDLLNRARVWTVDDLSKQDPSELYRRMLRRQRAAHVRLPSPPNVEVIRGWVNEAFEMERKVTR